MIFLGLSCLEKCAGTFLKTRQSQKNHMTIDQLKEFASFLKLDPNPLILKVH